MPDGDESGRLWPDAATGRTVRGVLLAALVMTAGVVAGCGALSDGTPTDATTPTSATTPTPTSTPEAPLRSNLSASPTTVFQRVEDLVGAELQAYPGVRVGTVESENVPRPFFLQVVGPPEDRSTLEQRPVARFDGQTITVDRERVAAGEGAVIEAELAYYAMGLLGRDHGWTGGTDRPHGGAILRQSYRYVVDTDGEFVGSEMVADQRADGTEERMVGIRADGRGIPRSGYDILVDGDRVGHVTSGTKSPTFNVPLALGYVEDRHADPGTDVLVETRDRTVEATVVDHRFLESID